MLAFERTIDMASIRTFADSYFRRWFKLTTVYFAVHVTFYLSHVVLLYQSYQTPGKAEDYPECLSGLRSFIPWAIRAMCLLQLPIQLLNAIGYLSFNAFPSLALSDELPSSSEISANQNLPNKIIVRIVTVGRNAWLIRRSVRWHSELLIHSGIRNYQIQIITENPVGLDKSKTVDEVVVPTDYSTPNGSLYKTRNLFFARQHYTGTTKHSTTAKNGFCHIRHPSGPTDRDNSAYAWIIHLDEETMLTRFALRNMLKMIRKGKFRVGHGIIAFGWSPETTFVSTFLDAVRTAFDCGHIYASLHFLKRSLTYIKGGCVVMREDLVDEIGFDFGPKLSLNEDIGLAQRLASKGEPIKFLKGIVMEETPQSIMALVRQRSRWIRGMMYEIVYGGHAWLPTLMLCSVYAMCWSCVPFWLLHIIAISLKVNMLLHPVVEALAAVVIATGFYGYFYGSIIGFRFRNDLQGKLLLFFACLTTVPQTFAVIFEGICVIRGTFCFAKEVLHDLVPLFELTPKHQKARDRDS